LNQYGIVRTYKVNVYKTQGKVNRQNYIMHHLTRFKVLKMLFLFFVSSRLFMLKNVNTIGPS